MNILEFAGRFVSHLTRFYYYEGEYWFFVYQNHGGKCTKNKSEHVHKLKERFSIQLSPLIC